MISLSGVHEMEKDTPWKELCVTTKKRPDKIFKICIPWLNILLFGSLKPIRKLKCLQKAKAAVSRGGAAGSRMVLLVSQAGIECQSGSSGHKKKKPSPCHAAHQQQHVGKKKKKNSVIFGHQT